MTDASNNQDRRVGYVGELGVKMPCRVAALVNIDLEGLQTVNGIALAENDYVLCTAQDDATENGPYQVSTGTWNRAVWFNNELAAVSGTLIFTVEGTLKSSTLWQTVCDDNPIDFGTSEINFNFFATSGAGTFLFAANNLDDVDSTSTSLTNLGFSVFVKTLIDDVDAATYRTSLGLGTAAVQDTGTSSGDVPLIGTSSATETLAGLAEIATQAETNLGTDDTKSVTPLKLLNASGHLIQFARSLLATQSSTAATIPRDNTKPQQSEGTEFTTLAFTPKLASSTLKITCPIWLGGNGSNALGCLFVDSGTDALSIGGGIVTTSRLTNGTFCYIIASGSTSPRTYKLRYGGETGTTYINQTSDNTYGDVNYSGIIIEEYA